MLVMYQSWILSIQWGLDWVKVQRGGSEQKCKFTPVEHHCWFLTVSSTTTGTLLQRLSFLLRTFFSGRKRTCCHLYRVSTLSFSLVISRLPRRWVYTRNPPKRWDVLRAYPLENVRFLHVKAAGEKLVRKQRGILSKLVKWEAGRWQTLCAEKGHTLQSGYQSNDDKVEWEHREGELILRGLSCLFFFLTKLQVNQDTIHSLS